MTTQMLRTHLKTALLAGTAAISLTLAGCSGGEKNDVATLGGNGSSQAASDQADTAIAMVNCLQEAGVPAELANFEGQEAAVAFDTDQAYRVGWVSDMWEAGVGENATPVDYDHWMEVWDTMAEAYQAIDDAEANQTWHPQLFIGGQDHSEALATCLDQTGYQHPTYQVDPAEQLKHLQESAQASATWATCARENGYPNIKDPDPPTLGDDDYNPQVLLPFDMQVAELETLLTACPNFDRAAHEAADLASQDPKTDWDKFQYPVDPSIGFDIPANFDWAAQIEASDRFDALYQLLHRESMAFYGVRDGGMSVQIAEG